MCYHITINEENKEIYVGFSKLYEDENLNVCSNGINIRDVQRYALKRLCLII